jgi:Icc-related predicted phosphoesterase
MRVKAISDLHHGVEHLAAAAADADQLLVLGDLINVVDYRTWEGILVDVFGREPVMESARLRAEGRFDDARAAFIRHVGDLEDGRKRFLELAREQYREVFENLPAGTIVTFGNVDIPDLLHAELPGHVRFADAEAIELGGVTFGFVGGGVRTPLGIPGEVDEETYDAKFAAVGPVDVICTHMPPRIPWFVYDVIARKFEPGSTGLLAYVQEHQPRYALFGHVHNPMAGRGTIRRTELVNVGHFQAHGRGFVIDTDALTEGSP